MFKKLNKKGFTLAELLVVVAIIGVLVAVSIPVFTSQLEKARDAADAANVRAAIAEASASYLTDEGTTPKTTYKYKFDGKSTDNKWSQTDSEKMEIGGVEVSAVTAAKGITINFGNNGIASVSLDTAAPDKVGAQ